MTMDIETTDATVLDAWLAQHGTESQRARRARDLLPEVELRDAIRAWALAPLDRFERFLKIKPGEIDHTAECRRERDGLECTDEPAKLNAPQFDLLIKIEAALKELPAGVEATHGIIRRRCRLRCCSGSLARVGVRIEAKYAGIALSRELGL
jgi:hypothetical protein